MSIVKIQSVRRLKNTVDYMTRDHKTNETLISTYSCNRHTIVEEFKEVQEEKKKKSRRNFKPNSKMIIQSFGREDNITPETAHKAGKELADNYLKGDHQYIITTHLDTDHIHNHIVFNQVRLSDLKMFDTTRKNTIDKLRAENDKVSQKFGLYIPNEKSHENKIHYVNHKELKLREKGKSFKEKLEVLIDEVIENAESYEEFLELMEKKGLERKEGKYLAYRSPDKKFYIRTKKMGMHYTENSIRYRINNKDFKVHKYQYTIATEKIDKSQEKFKGNYGLRKWATKKNITHLQEISDLVFNKDMTLEEIENLNKTEHEFISDLQISLDDKDSMIYDLQNKTGSFEVYKNSASLMISLKKAKNKMEFKSKNYKEIIKHDVAKKNITQLKDDFGIESESELTSFINELKKDRDKIYKNYTKLQKDHMKEKQKKHKKYKKQRRSL